MASQIGRLPDHRGIHLQHGPIDLVIRCEGTAEACEQAYGVATRGFEDILPTLVTELSIIRQPLTPDTPAANGPVAKRMINACSPYLESVVTPMAAVAGAVSDYVLGNMLATPGLTRAWVNNGGDIAVWLKPDEKFDCGIIAPAQKSGSTRWHRPAEITISGRDGIGGIATSGRATKGQGGRSFSLGIADAVTVLARDAAAADVAATLIANDVDIPDHKRISRKPALEFDPDSDLGNREVVIDVGVLSSAEQLAALERGGTTAQSALDRGLIMGAYLTLGEKQMVLGHAGISKS